MNKQLIPKEEIEKLKAEIKQNFDHATEQVIHWKDKRNQFKGGLIALEMLSQKDKKTEKQK